MKIAIGIDAGVNTGYAVWDRLKRSFVCIETFPIHVAMNRVLFWSQLHDVHVYVEDARLAVHGRSNDCLRQVN